MTRRSFRSALAALGLLALSLLIASSLTALFDRPLVALAQDVPYYSASFTSSGSSPLVVPLSGQSSCYAQEVQASGKAPGPVNVYGSNDGVNFNTQLTFYDSIGATHAQPFTPTNKVNYGVTPVGFMFIEIAPDSSWNATTQSATVTARCSVSFDAMLLQISGPFSSLNCSGLATCSPNAGPTPSVSVTVPCPTAGTNVTITGTNMPACSIAASGGGGSGGLATPASAPTSNPSPNTGYVQLTGGLYIGPNPSPSPTTDAHNSIIMDTYSSCAGDLMRMGPDQGHNTLGVNGDILGLYCGTSLEESFSSNGSLGVAVSVWSQKLYAYDGNGSCPSPTDGDALFACSGAFNWGQILLGGSGTAGTNYCVIDWNRVTSGYLVPQCPIELDTSTKNVGAISCTVSSATSCNGTATVRSGAKCVAAYEESSTTVTLADLSPLQVHTSSTTLTVYMQTTVAQTGTLAANYWCP